jgi:peptidyl-prolyl cis-trans isomerase B (cyclophilin B)
VAASKNTEREAREARDRLRRYNARQSVHTHQVTRRKRDNVLSVVGLVIVAALAAATQIFFFTSGPGKPTPASSASASPSASPSAAANIGDIPASTVAEDRDWTGNLTLNKVRLGITLDGKAAPQAVSAFVTEVKAGYFPGKTCHRLLLAAAPDAAGLIQCGSTDGKGGGDADYQFGPIENAPADGIYKAGTIAMARIGDNGYSQGHQFFIVFEDTALPADSAGGYTVFGTVTSGLDQLKSQIVSGGVTGGTKTSGDGAPVIATKITSVTIK